MKQSTVNYRRITSIVKTKIDYHVHLARDYEDAKSKGIADSEYIPVLPEIEIVKSGRIEKVFVKINEAFLQIVGYDDNLEGFLHDYFGSDFVYSKDDPLRFRFVDGYLLNPYRPTSK